MSLITMYSQALSFSPVGPQVRQPVVDRPKLAVAYQCVGDALAQQTDHQSAVPMLEQATKLYTNYAPAYANLAGKPARMRALT